jgi:hypothetical protein
VESQEGGMVLIGSYYSSSLPAVTFCVLRRRNFPISPKNLGNQPRNEFSTEKTFSLFSFPLTLTLSQRERGNL